MHPDRWKEIKRVFDEVADLPATEQRVFLDAACPDAEFRREIERMLAADSSTLLDESPLSVFAVTDDDAHFKDKRIGRYRILREVGRGGMGAVFLALRDDGEFEQKVAVKIIKTGLGTDAILRRFRHERQILARLEHPNIARLLDGGISEDGLPFYVMEFIEGEPVDDFCRAHELSLAQRLELFRQICAAVSYAHQRLIVHRDLKPSNILVTKDGQVKLLDFGIAKVLSQDETSSLPRQQQTATQLGLMTPDYASPEQFRGEAVTTATDVYSLGVVLYQLLTGALPYNLAGLRLDEMLRIVCESEPVRPSRVFAGSTLGFAKNLSTVLHTSNGGAQSVETRPSVAPSKSLRPATRNPQMKGDVDNIVLKALRKEPEHRYASVEQFSEDIGRFLSGLPIQARAATFGYRAGKFISRNRAAAALSALILLTLVGGIITTSWQAVRAERERRLAEKRFEQSRALANSLVFKYHDAIAELPNSSTVRELLLKDASSYLDSLAEDAGGDLSLMREVASAYAKLADLQGRPHGASLGNTAAAIENYEKAVRLLESIAAHSTKSARMQVNKDLLHVYDKLRMTLSRAKENLERRNELRDKRMALLGEMLAANPDNLGFRLELTKTHTTVGNRLLRANFDEGFAYYKQHILPVLAEAERIAPEAPETEGMKIEIYSDLGWYFGEQGRLILELEEGAQAAQPYFDSALDFFRETAKLYEVQYRRDESNAANRRRFKMGICNVGISLGDAGRVEESFGYLRECLNHNIELARFDPNNLQAVFDIADSLNSIAVYHRRKRDYAKANAHFEQALEKMESVISADPKHHEAINYKLELLVQMGNTRAEAGDLTGALRLYEQAKKFAESSLTSEPSDRIYYGRVYLHAGRALIRFAEREPSPARARELWLKAQAELQRADEIVDASQALETAKQLSVIRRQLSKCEKALG